MKTPCETAARYLLPAVRALIARKLIENHGYMQSEASSKLGISPSAMSRYLASERGRILKFTEEIEALAESIAAGISRGRLSQQDVSDRLCSICMIYRKSGDMCRLEKALRNRSKSLQSAGGDFCEIKVLTGPQPKEPSYDWQHPAPAE